MADILEGSGRPDPRELPGNRKRFRPGDPIEPLQFGKFGELTPRTIAQAGLTGEAKKLAYDMLKVQAAYMELLECLWFPVDQHGAVHNLAAIEPTRQAIAYTLALCGFRQSGKCRIRKQQLGSLGWWVDIRAPEQPVPPQPWPAPEPPKPEGWHVEPTITWETVPREEVSGDRAEPG